MKFFSLLLPLLPLTLARTIYVKSPNSIQAAINRAYPGDTISVGPGPYTEQLLVKKPIKLVGHNSQLSPPTKFKKNVCSDVAGGGTIAGICVAGSGIVKQPFKSEHQKISSVSKPLEGVSISGFTVTGFAGANIMLLGTKNAHVEHNTLVDGAVYGALSDGSFNSFFSDNTITSSDLTNPGFIAICMDNFSGACATGNTISAYAIGLCVETDGATLSDNTLSYTCNSVFVDPFTSDVQLTSNHIDTSYTQCDGFGAYGIVLDGSTSAHVASNTIENQHSDNGPAAGIFVTDDPCADPNSISCPVLGEPAIARKNYVVGNLLQGNDLDINNNSTGSGNVFKKNKCTTSVPDGYCHRLP